MWGVFRAPPGVADERECLILVAHFPASQCQVFCAAVAGSPNGAQWGIDFPEDASGCEMLVFRNFTAVGARVGHERLPASFPSGARLAAEWSLSRRRPRTSALLVLLSPLCHLHTECVKSPWWTARRFERS
jgi:hypothetical protein